jgi:phosphopantothenoylcysteine decarboxylase/phosphopantothenate--cysteine ligase
LILSTKAKVAVAPACDADMWTHAATQANVKRLKELGYEVWGPEKGELASGKVGWGRFREPEDLVNQALGKA